MISASTTIFSRQVEAFGNAGDVLVVFSTTGNSANILAPSRPLRNSR